MVDFTLTDDRHDPREMTHDFALKEIHTVAWDYDRERTWPAGDNREGLADEQSGSRSVRRRGRVITRRLPNRRGAVVGCAGIGTTLGANGLASVPLMLGGSEDLKKEYLGRLTGAPLLASFA